ncbi:hypothetical protein EVAR_53754_1 [Eumeta japonica]|uniref:Uncharacterized protein n=1 Tax=Eumeta variegata TaxID=151549 RepID=A0A4C1ZF34_EUMVA|nr:hypothetical protein EVAR_53754_1 [Eumeta japonica]
MLTIIQSVMVTIAGDSRSIPTLALKTCNTNYLYQLPEGIDHLNSHTHYKKRKNLSRRQKAPAHAALFSNLHKAFKRRDRRDIGPAWPSAAPRDDRGINNL